MAQNSDEEPDPTSIFCGLEWPWKFCSMFNHICLQTKTGSVGNPSQAQCGGAWSKLVELNFLPTPAKFGLPPVSSQAYNKAEQGNTDQAPSGDNEAIKEISEILTETPEKLLRVMPDEFENLNARIATFRGSPFSLAWREHFARHGSYYIGGHSVKCIACNTEHEIPEEPENLECPVSQYWAVYNGTTAASDGETKHFPECVNCRQNPNTPSDKIRLPRSVTVKKECAFCSCDLKDVNYDTILHSREHVCRRPTCQKSANSCHSVKKAN